MENIKNLSVEQARQRMNVSRKTIYEVIHLPGFPAFRIGRKILINADLLDAWIAKQIERGVDGR